MPRRWRRISRARFPRQQLPGALAAWLHQRTDGNPLFLVTLVQALLDQGVLHEHGGVLDGAGRAGHARREVPASLSQVLDQQITRLAPALQRVLEVASVAGVEFTAAAVAAGLEAAAEVVEAHCDALVTQQLLRPLGVTTWPNGTVTTRYAFRHALVSAGGLRPAGSGRSGCGCIGASGRGSKRRMERRPGRSPPYWRTTSPGAPMPRGRCTISTGLRRKRPSAMPSVRSSLS